MKASGMSLNESETLYASAYRDHLRALCVEPDAAGLDPERAELIREALLRAQRDHLRSGWRWPGRAK